MNIKVIVNETLLTFEVEEALSGELLFSGKDDEVVIFFDNGGKKEDLINPIKEYMKEVNNLPLEFFEFGNLYHRLYFEIDIYELIKTLK